MKLTRKKIVLRILYESIDMNCWYLISVHGNCIKIMARSILTTNCTDASGCIHRGRMSHVNDAGALVKLVKLEDMQ